ATLLRRPVLRRCPEKFAPPSPARHGLTLRPWRHLSERHVLTGRWLRRRLCRNEAPRTRGQLGHESLWLVQGRRPLSKAFQDVAADRSPCGAPGPKIAPPVTSHSGTGSH